MQKFWLRFPFITGIAVVLGVSLGLMAVMAASPLREGSTAPQQQKSPATNSAPIAASTPNLSRSLNSPNSDSTPEPSQTPQPSQTPEAEDRHFSGQIVSINGNTWMVGNVTVTVGISTEVRPTAAAAVVGAFVYGEGIGQPDGSILAREVVVVTPNAEPKQVHFAGKITAQNGNHWVVGGLSVTVAITTEIRPNAAAAVVGAMVTGEGFKQPDGSILAWEITVEMREPRPIEVHFAGTIKSKNGDSWVIGDVTVTVNITTEIHPSAAAAVVGAFVRGEGIKRLDGTIIAKEIEVVTPPGGTVEQRVEFRGLINSFAADVWVVDGKPISITAQTQIHGTPKVGAIAEVEALKKADGSLIALQIEVETQETEQTRVEFKGVINAFGPTQWTVGGKTVVISPTTVISGTPQIGLIAEVKAIKNGTTLTATFIKVEKPEAQEIDFKGQVTARNGNLWMIGGKVVTTSASTLIDESRGLIKVGTQVEVKGVLLADGSVQASRIRADR